VARPDLRPEASLLEPSPDDRTLALTAWLGRPLANRTLADGSVLGLADAVLNEKAGRASLPRYSHIAAATNIARQD
jgi:hypothetical protein